MATCAAPEVFTLDLTTVRDAHFVSWRLRAEPCMEAEEIGYFMHDDEILAVRDPAQPGWLKLFDESQCGWVKEAHEDCSVVWKAGQSQSSNYNVEAEPASIAGKVLDRESASRSSKYGESVITSSCSASSGSQSSFPPQTQTPFKPLPIPFTGMNFRLGSKADTRNSAISDALANSAHRFAGQSYRIACKASSSADDECSTAYAGSPRSVDTDDMDAADMLATSAKATNAQCFTGTGFRLARSVSPAQSTSETDEEVADSEHGNSVACAAKPRWADLVESDEEDHGIAPALWAQTPDAHETTASVHEQIAACAAKPRWADMANSDDEDDALLDSTAQLVGVPTWYSNAEASTEGSDEDEEAVYHDSSACAAQLEAFDGPPRDRKFEVVQNSRRQQRNRTHLQKKNKTQLCRYLVTEGACPFGDTCWFAHSEEEVQTEIEANALANYCVPYNPHAPGFGNQVNAPFGHSIQASKPKARQKDLPKWRYKTTLCKHFHDNQGWCPFGSACSYAHGVDELRATVSDA